MDRFFHVTEKGSTIRTEIMAGITTFMAMAYILMVNAGMFSNPFGDGTDVLGVSYGAIYVATAISAVVGTLLIGLLSNLPLAQASGMGLNAYFVYTVWVCLGLSYANALLLLLFHGITAADLPEVLFGFGMCCIGTLGLFTVARVAGSDGRPAIPRHAVG